MENIFNISKQVSDSDSGQNEGSEVPDWRSEQPSVIHSPYQEQQWDLQLLHPLSLGFNALEESDPEQPGLQKERCYSLIAESEEQSRIDTASSYGLDDSVICPLPFEGKPNAIDEPRKVQKSCETIQPKMPATKVSVHNLKVELIRLFFRDVPAAFNTEFEGKKNHWKEGSALARCREYFVETLGIDGNLYDEYEAVFCFFIYPTRRMGNFRQHGFSLNLFTEVKGLKPNL